MKINEIKKFVSENIRYKNHTFHIGQKGEAIYLQVQFTAKDNFTGIEEVQKCRKFQLSEWMTPTEIVQTAWLAIQRSELHEAAENFKYEGCDIFNTHISVDALAGLCRNNNYEHRNITKNEFNPTPDFYNKIGGISKETVEKNAELKKGTTINELMGNPPTLPLKKKVYRDNNGHFRRPDEIADFCYDNLSRIVKVMKEDDFSIEGIEEETGIYKRYLKSKMQGRIIRWKE